MEEKFENLAAAINIFTEELDLSKGQSIGILDSDIRQGYIDKNRLKEELEIALADPNFEWLDFAIKNRLIVYDIERYNNDNVKSYIQTLIGNYIYSDDI